MIRSNSRIPLLLLELLLLLLLLLGATILCVHAQSDAEDDSARTPPPYHSSEYWEERYSNRTKENEIFDWYISTVNVATMVFNPLFPSDRGNMSVLVLGCGNSALSQDMYDIGFTNITSIDISPTVVQYMKDLNKEERPDMKWFVMDVQKMDFPDQTFDYVIDKGTLDALVCGDDNSDILSRMNEEVHRVLKPDGKYSVITFGEPENRFPVLSNSSFWKVEHNFLYRESASRLHHYLMLKEKKGEEDEFTPDVPAYGIPKYWDERFKTEVDFDWFMDYTDLRPHIDFALQSLNQSSRILIVGAGTSNLARGLYQNDGFHNILNVDQSRVAVQRMSVKHRQCCPFIQDIRMDVRAMPLPSQSVDLILDKGCMDALFCGENAAKDSFLMLRQMHRVLRKGGQMVVLTYGSPESRMGYFEAAIDAGVGWAVEHREIEKEQSGGETTSYHMYVFTKVRGKTMPSYELKEEQGSEGGVPKVEDDAINPSPSRKEEL